MSHVFNFDAPWHPDDYVHRIGRTGRAGATGKAFTFITEEDAEALANIEKLIGTTIPEVVVEGVEASPQDEKPRDKPAKGRALARARSASPPNARRARTSRVTRSRVRRSRATIAASLHARAARNATTVPTMDGTARCRTFSRSVSAPAEP